MTRRRPRDIPQDVWATAIAAADKSQLESYTVGPIARAILAERQRCADVADTEAERARASSCTQESLGAIWARNAILLGATNAR